MSKPGIVKFLYTQNPFYLIGTAILLYGLRIATDSGDYFSTHPHALPLILGHGDGGHGVDRDYHHSLWRCVG